VNRRLAGQLATGDADDLHPTDRRAEVSQHRPKTLDALVIHKDIGANLQKLVCVSGCFLPLECNKCVIKPSSQRLRRLLRATAHTRCSMGRPALAKRP